MATLRVGVLRDSADDLIGRSAWVVEGRLVPLDEGRSAWAVEGRVVRLDEGGRSAWIVEGRLVPLDEGEGLHG